MKTLKFLICIYCSLFFFSCSDSESGGGIGTESNPYRIRYADQLRYCLEQDKGFYRLESDIDLKNQEWYIGEFNGTLDGNGHTIYNLKIKNNGTNNPCGFISQLYGTVKNLNLQGVYIKSDGKYVGTIAGKLEKNALIDNCSVTLLQGSLIQGGAYVGGVAGFAYGQIFDSKVDAIDDSAIICGDYQIGGIAGEASELSGCSVNCDVVGNEYVGGLVGRFYNSYAIENSIYKGSIKGRRYVGGIVGRMSSYNSVVAACRAVVDIEGDNYMGGICGDLNSGKIIACYSEGRINNAEANYVGGIAGYSVSNYIYLSYSAIKCSKLTNTTITDSYSVYTCDNVTEKMRDAYSDYAEYWNFNNQWVWTGEVDGTAKMVQCPRLAWEAAGAAQATGSIGGVVTDADTGKPIKGVKITMSPLDYVAVTDANGLYMFEDIKSDRIYSVEFVKSGYKSVVNNVNVIAGKVTDADVAMTMLNGEPMVWNGEIASAISEGSGTIYDPYLIRTGGELLYAMKQGKGHLKIVNNIDLNNHNWKPYSFSGSFDGDGFTISNLRIERDDETYNGLIGYLTGTVKNIVLEGVYIKTTKDNVGAVVGYMSGDAATRISNCHVTLKNGSLIAGSKNVGGIVGYANKSGVANCSIKSTDADAVISGSSYVGGIVACAAATISDCKVDCNIVGTQYVGGIAGYKSNGSNVDTIERCEFNGKINGTECLGGIVGYMSSYHTSIVACRANAVLDGNKYIAGLCGSLNSGKIIACYSEGRINSVQGNYTYIGALAGYGGSGEIYLSYSTIECEKLSSAAVTDSYSVYTCDNVSEALRTAYSDYAAYWNFSDEWIWNGVVNGVSKSVKCPRLAWQ